MSQTLNADQELLSDVVACQLVIKQILDVLDVIAPVEVREKMSSQLKSIDFSSHPAGADPVTMRAIQKAVALIELKFTPQNESHYNKPLFQVLERFFCASQNERRERREN